MFFFRRISMDISGHSSAETIDAIARAIGKSERVLIGAGAGLSAAAGIDYTDTITFARVFPKWAERGYRMQYEFVGFEDWLEPAKWAYWATHLNHVFYQFPPSPLYQKLHAIIRERDFYVITSNADGLFIKSGFEADRVFQAQGNYERLRCTKSCTPETWDTKPFIDRILLHINYETLEVADPAALPTCPNCGAPLFVAFRAREEYAEQAANYHQWLNESLDQRLVVMEIGVGFNTPGVIRWPFERLVNIHGDVLFVRINGDYRSFANTARPEIPHEIRSKSVSIHADAAEIITALHDRLITCRNSHQ
jgi:NAD-dependent SIR2 family protein deacetylase